MRVVLRNLGNALLILSVFLILPLIVSLVYGENSFLFIAALAASLVLGVIFRMSFDYGALDFTRGLVLAACSYIAFSVIGIIPYLRTLTFSNALFESVSGFTTTGLTTISDLEIMPKSLLFWRAETQWIGGIGIVILFLFIITYLSRPRRMEELSASVETSSSLYQAAGFSEKIQATIKQTAKRVFNIYLIYTIAGIILLTIAGMPFYDSIAMAFTSISTGGFVTRNVLDYNNWVLLILGILMVAGSVSFFLHDKLLRGKIIELFRKTETKIFISLIAVAFLISLVAVKNIKVILFQLISAFTTTGYTLVDVTGLPSLFISVLIIGMAIGGNIASTSGGIKIFRISLLIKTIPWVIKKLSSPSTSVIPFKINDKVVEDKDIVITQVFFTSYVLIAVISTLLLMILGNSFLDSGFQAISALGTVGLQTLDIASAGIIAKIILMACMLLGRLEIFPIMVLLRRLFVK